MRVLLIESSSRTCGCSSWKSPKTRADLSQIDLPETKQLGEVPLTDEIRRALSVCLTTAVKTRDDRDDQVRLVEQLGAALGVDYRQIAESRILGTVDAVELRELRTRGMDVQLHTHRHFFPPDPAIAAEEIAANRTALAEVAGEEMTHFAYPRGEWSPGHWPLLRAAGIETATTCDSGLVYPDTPALALNRIVDSARVSQIEFEAEMSGFTELLRRVRRRNRPRGVPIREESGAPPNASSSRPRC